MRSWWRADAKFLKRRRICHDPEVKESQNERDIMNGAVGVRWYWRVEHGYLIPYMMRCH